MEARPHKTGSIFTRYSIFIVGVIGVLAVVLIAAGGFVYTQVRPDEPTVTSPLSGTTIGENPPLFEGTMPLRSALKIFIDDKEVATRSYQGTTLWSYTPEQQLEIGEHTIAVQAIGEEGLRSKKSTPITFTVPKRPQISNIRDGQEFFRGDKITLSGIAEKNTEVDLYLDGQFLLTTKSDGSGHWVFNAVPEIRPGKHSVYVVAVNTIGEFRNASEKMDIIITNTAK